MQWENLNEEWLREEYVSKQHSLSEMGMEIGCNRHTVKKALKHLGVPIRPNKKNVDAEYAKELYQQGVSVVEISRIFGCVKETVYKKLRLLDITIGKGGTLDSENLKDMYLIQQLSTVEIAKRIGYDSSSIVHALHRHGIPSRTIKEGQMLRANRLHPQLGDENWLQQKYIDEKLSMERVGQLIGASSSVVHSALRRYGILSHPVAFRSEGSRCTALPTFPEKVFIMIRDKYSLHFKYVGNRAFWIGDETQHLNPDFIATNGAKVLVEVMGDYWHSPLLNKSIRENSLLTYRRIFYKKHKWKCVFIWETDLLREDAEQFVLSLLKRELGDKFCP